MICSATSLSGDATLTFMRMWDGGRAVPFTVRFKGSSRHGRGGTHNHAAGMGLHRNAQQPAGAAGRPPPQWDYSPSPSPSPTKQRLPLDEAHSLHSSFPGGRIGIASTSSLGSAATGEVTIRDPNFQAWRGIRERAATTLQRVERGRQARRHVRCPFGGVGFILEQREDLQRGAWAVAYVALGGPAEQLLRVGDAVVECDGRPLPKDDSARAERMVRAGGPFTAVILTAVRDGAAFRVPLTRRALGSDMMPYATAGLGVAAAVMGDAVVVSAVHPGGPASASLRVAPGDVLRFAGRPDGVPLTPKELEGRMMGPVGSRSVL